MLLDSYSDECQGRKWSLLGVYLVLAVMFTGVVLAVAYNPLRR